MINLLKKLGSRYRGELIFSLASYTTPIVGMWASVLTARFLLPEELGAIQTVMLVLPYAAFLQLGVINGLNRNLAYYIGRDDMETAQRNVNAVAYIVNIVSGIGVLIGLAVMLIQIRRHTLFSIEVGACIALTSLLVFTPRNMYLGGLFRSGQHFQRLGQITFIENAARFFYALLPAVMGWAGRVAGEAVRPVIGVLLKRKFRPYTPNGGFTKEDFKSLLQAGTPLMITGYLLSVFSVADQTLIALHFDKVELGYYSLSRLVITALMIVPTTMGTMLYPKASTLYGREKTPAALRPFFWKSLFFNTLVYVPVCALAFFTLEPVVRVFLPNYILGLDAAKVNILTCMTLISYGPSVIAGVLKKVIPVLVFYGIAVGLIWVVGQYMCINQQPDIVHIAWVRFYVAGVLSMAIMIYNYWLTTRPADTTSGA